MRLNWLNAVTSSGPNITGSSAARACPSPCSPDSDPPNFAHRAAASPRNDPNAATPLAVTRSKLILVCTQPCP